MIALPVLAALATGAATVALLRVRCSTGWGLLGFSFFLGAVVLALWTHVLLLARVSVPAVLAAPLLLAGMALRFGDRSVFAVRWPWSRWGVPIAAAVLFLLAGALSWRELGFDPEVYYAIKVRSIVTYGTIWNPDFTDPLRVHAAVRRPLLLPCLSADLFLLDGRIDHRLARAWFALMAAGGLGVLYERARPHPAWLAVFAWLPVHWRESGCLYAGWADPLLGILFALALDALRKNERGLAALSLAAAVLLKQDAWAFPVAVGVAALVRPRDLLRWWPALGAGAAVAGLWFGLSRLLPDQPDFQQGQFAAANVLASPGRWPQVLARYGSEMVRLKHWALLWLLVPVAVFARRWSREETWWFLALALQLLAYVAVQATYPAGEVRMWTRFQGMRLLSHLAPGFWMWIAMRARAMISRSCPT